MKNIDKMLIEEALRSIEPGSLIMNRYTENGAEAPLKWGFDRETTPNGRGRFDSYALYPGIDAAFGWFVTDSLTFCHQAPGSVLEIFYCHRGRVVWKMKDGTEVFLNPGEIIMQTMDHSNDSEIILPLGHASVFSMSMDPRLFSGSLPDYLRAIHFDADKLQAYFAEKDSIVVAANQEQEIFFHQLYCVTERLRFPFLKFKIQELLGYLYLFIFKTDYFSPVLIAHAKEIEQIHDDLIKNLDQPFSIAQLAKDNYIDVTTLQQEFKLRYGAPIATYIRRKRIESAIELQKIQMTIC